MALSAAAPESPEIAAPVLAALGDVQFDATSTADVERLAADTEDVIRSWT